MVCQQLDELEWDFIQAREESPDLDSLGWTDREFSCLDAYSITSERGIKANAAFGIKYHSDRAGKTSTRRRYLAKQLMETFVREEPDDEEDEQDEGDDDNEEDNDEEDDDEGYSE